MPDSFATLIRAKNGRPKQKRAAHWPARFDDLLSVLPEEAYFFLFFAATFFFATFFAFFFAATTAPPFR
jgi:uncharacterized membrane protein HdeD (DUF308 family)